MTDAFTTDVAIIGGGIAGLACAVALIESGVNKVAVFEAGEKLGGRAQSWADTVTTDVVDIGPHIFLTAYRNTLKFLDLLGTSERVVWQFDPLIRLREGRRVTDMFVHRLPAPLHLAPSFAKVSSVSLRDKLSNAANWQERPSVIASNIIFSHRAHTLTDQEIVARTVTEIKGSMDLSVSRSEDR